MAFYNHICVLECRGYISVTGSELGSNIGFPFWIQQDVPGKTLLNALHDRQNVIGDENLPRGIFRVVPVLRNYGRYRFADISHYVPG
jgi:hypothetical protein